MKRLFELGNQYVRESDWKDLALVKFCLCAMGIMIGTQIPTKHKKVVVAGAFLLSVSPQFFGWVTGIESGMRITGPESVKADYAQYLKNIIANYEVEDMVACRET